MSFTKDLKESLEVEQAFIERLNNSGLKAGGNSSSTIWEKRLYDIWDSRYRLFEVKYDRLAAKTGNVYFEDESLIRSKADYFIYKLKGDKSFYYLEKKDLPEFLSNPLMKKITGGDQNAKGSLAPLVFFKERFAIWPLAK